jgi:dihydroxyacetone kinase-like protein
MSGFKSSEGASVVFDVADAVRENKAYLSEVDGAIGDGDHGVNMSKGFSLAKERIDDAMDFSQALKTLGKILLSEIGGAMGPLYGSFFRAMSRAAAGHEEIDADLFKAMLEQGLEKLKELGGAKVGDKTLIDTIDPAVNAYAAALADGAGFSEALSRMSEAAERGRDSTKELTAKIGRASRLGDRSRGHLDAGAVSSCLILSVMAASIKKLL